MELLNVYLNNHNTNMYQFHKLTGIPETTVRNLNKKPLNKWTMEQIDAIASTVNKKREIVLKELESISELSSQEEPFGHFNLENRRYIGSKSKILGWIKQLIEHHTVGNSFFDVFAGTGVVTKELLNNFDMLILNDFLFSNNIIYHAFFGMENFDKTKLTALKKDFQKIVPNYSSENYFLKNYGDKFFSKNDACIIGEIREQIDKESDLNAKERSILIASLIYSADKTANTVGHYDAYRKNIDIADKFVFELLNPIDVQNKKIEIFREDANALIRDVKADIAFIDPPYNSRQYSRFYHVLEGLAKWDKPKLEGVAMKPPAENMSLYSKSSAPIAFDDLVTNLNVNYIVVTYNNTYKPKSSSSRNKITHSEILGSLNKVGKTTIFEKPFQFFNAGKTDLKDHKEFVFITKVDKKTEKSTLTNAKKTSVRKKGAIRSPLFYVGDKYKLMPQLKELFPNSIASYYDVFCGGGSASINVNAKFFFMNDIDGNVTALHKHLQKESLNMDLFIKKMHRLIAKYGLSFSEKGNNKEIEKLKKEYNKTYFSKYNKKSYLMLREDYNADKSNIDLLYLLLVYGFNHMIRFNLQGEFNLPVGNVDWNKNVTNALNNYSCWYNTNTVSLSSGLDFEDFVTRQQLSTNDFLYFDPPYLITSSDYNKLWDEKEEKRLYNLLDKLNSKHIKWGLSNMLTHKGKENKNLIEWAKKYDEYEIESNYISRFDNTIKKSSKEIYVTNAAFK